MRQDDTYFNVPQGRLKLRREAGAAAHLIAYERPDLRGQKESRYRIVEVGDASGIEEALAVVPQDIPNATDGRAVPDRAVASIVVVVVEPVWQGSRPVL